MFVWYVHGGSEHVLNSCIAGWAVPFQKMPVSEGYQVPFARAIRQAVQIPTAAVGLITRAQHAHELIEQQDADLVLLARELLRDPFWALRAAVILGAPIPCPIQYERAWISGKT